MTLDPSLVLLAGSDSAALPVICIRETDWPDFERGLNAAQQAWLSATGFRPRPGTFALIPGKEGAIARVVFIQGPDPFVFGKLARGLPKGNYRLEGDLPDAARLAVLAWALEAYRFERYRSAGEAPSSLVVPEGVDRDAVVAQARAIYRVRDLINCPANDMGPDALEAVVREVAAEGGARVNVISGAELEEKFPLVHAVGRASAQGPRLAEFIWGEAAAPKITLVGKGVCFDTGGLDIKPSSGMLLMKKDMGGAANVLGLAQLVMGAGLAVRLRVLVPIVENSISAASFRPGDVLRSRKGLTVEIGNTDAEGRLVLADALALADEESPDLLIDMATLTGAARVALGPDLSPFYTEDASVAGDLVEYAQNEADPLWRMPLWQPYARMIESNIADISNSGEGGFAGSITAALFLSRFVERAKTHIHFDIYGWQPASAPGRPKGGEAQGIRALFALIAGRYPRPPSGQHP